MIDDSDWHLIIDSKIQDYRYKMINGMREYQARRDGKGQGDWTPVSLGSEIEALERRVHNLSFDSFISRAKSWSNNLRTGLPPSEGATEIITDLAAQSPSFSIGASS